MAALQPIHTLSLMDIIWDINLEVILMLICIILLEICGDGIVSGEEGCDDKNNVNGKFYLILC